MPAENQTPLDLYEIALLLNYERASTEPRFRNLKLYDIADNETEFQRTKCAHPDWDRAKNKRGFVFKLLNQREDGPDLPGNMMPVPVPKHLEHLTPSEVETIYWQARGHDGCFASAALLQHIFDLYPPSTRLRVRMPDGSAYETTTRPLDRKIQEFSLRGPKLYTLASTMTESYITGGLDPMLHAVVAFRRGQDEDESEDAWAVLDMSSMQFGDAGRGTDPRGRGSTFVLETAGIFRERMRNFAESAKLVKESQIIRPGLNDKRL